MIPERPLSPETEHNAAQAALPWVLRLRYGMAAGEAVVIVGMWSVFHLDFPLFWTLAPLALVLASNLLLTRLHGLAARFPRETLRAMFVLDTLCLTVMLGVTGGANNPFSLLYLVQITLSAVVLRRLWTWALGLLSAVCFGLLFYFFVPLAVLQGHHDGEGMSPHLVGMWIAFVAACALISYFTGEIATALRRREIEVLDLQDRVARHERLASLATLAAGAAHEFGTPLSTIAVVAKELERYAATLSGGDAVVEDAKLIRSEVERCRKILERMSAHGGEPLGETARSIPVRELLNEVVSRLPESQQTCVVIEIAQERLEAVLPEQAAVQSVAALVQNALHANRDRQPIVIRAAQQGSQLSISVRDRGHGMPENVLRRIAEPFFTTKEPGEGMGLGTFLVRTFAERLGGRLVFESTRGEGTTATLELPLQPAPQDVNASL